MEYVVLFNTNIVKFVWKSNEGEEESIVSFFNFCFLAVLEPLVDQGPWGMSIGGRKYYLGPAEIAPFSSLYFSHLNQILFKVETTLIFVLIIFYYVSFDQTSSADVLQNTCLQ